MTNDQTKKLALALLKADSEAQVIELLKVAGFWDKPEVWRLVGDRDGNFATIGSQQSRPEAALVEKIINSVDARLMNECLTRGIDPTSETAPPSIRHAVARFFESREPKGELGGTLQGWSQGNLYLKTDMKGAANDVAVMKAKFVYGNVLVGLALVHDQRNRHNGGGRDQSDDSGAEETIEAVVDRPETDLAVEEPTRTIDHLRLSGVIVTLKP